MWLAAALAALICLPSLGGGFVIDDRYLLVDNPAVRSLANIPSHFTTAWGGGFGAAGHTGVNAGYFRPVTSTLYSVEYALFGLHPFGWHAVSILLHALSTTLVVWLAARWLPPRLALVAGILFAVHPVHTEAIAAISYQTTLLASLLAMLAVAALDWAAEHASTRWAVLAGVATLLAGLAKEEALATPLLAAAWLALRRGAPFRRFTVGVFAATAVGATIALLMRARVVTGSSITYFGEAGASVVVPTLLGVLALYARLLAAPVRLCPFYDWFIVPPSRAITLDTVLGAALLVGVPLSAWWLRRRSPAAALGLSWMGLGLLPVLHVVPILNVAAERFLYLPSVGFALAVAVGAEYVWNKRPRFAWVMGGMILIAFSTRTLWRWPDWRDDRRLNTATADAFPETPTPLLNLAEIEAAAGNLELAVRHLREAEARAPGFPGVQATANRILRR